jgi:hypothetical protein
LPGDSSGPLWGSFHPKSKTNSKAVRVGGQSCIPKKLHIEYVFFYVASPLDSYLGKCCDGFVVDGFRGKNESLIRMRKIFMEDSAMPNNHSAFKFMVDNVKLGNSCSIEIVELFNRFVHQAS